MSWSWRRVEENVILGTAAVLFGAFLYRDYLKYQRLLEERHRLDRERRRRNRRRRVHVVNGGEVEELPAYESDSNQNDVDEEEVGGENAMFLSKEQQRNLRFLYLIAEKRSKMNGTAHRGVRCNECGLIPLRGVRFHCTECVDADLCHRCEEAGRHDSRHLLVKIYVPVPLVKSPRWIRKSLLPDSSVNRRFVVLEKLSESVLAQAAASVDMTKQEMQAAHSRFAMYADEQLPGKVVPYGISGETLGKILVPHDPNGVLANSFKRVYMGSNRVLEFETYLQVLHTLPIHATLNWLKLAGLAFRAFDVANCGGFSSSSVLDVLKAVKLLEIHIIAEQPEPSSLDERNRTLYFSNILDHGRPLASGFSMETDNEPQWPQYSQDTGGLTVEEVNERYERDYSKVTAKLRDKFGAQQACQLLRMAEVDARNDRDRIYQELEWDPGADVEVDMESWDEEGYKHAMSVLREVTISRNTVWAERGPNEDSDFDDDSEDVIELLCGWLKYAIF